MMANYRQEISSLTSITSALSDADISVTYSLSVQPSVSVQPSDFLQLPAISMDSAQMLAVVVSESISSQPVISTLPLVPQDQSSSLSTNVSMPVVVPCSVNSAVTLDAAASSGRGDIWDGLPLIIHAPSDAGLESENDPRQSFIGRFGSQTEEIFQRGSDVSVSDGLAGVKVASKSSSATGSVSRAVAVSAATTSGPRHVSLMPSRHKWHRSPPSRNRSPSWRQSRPPPRQDQRSGYHLVRRIPRSDAWSSSLEMTAQWT